MECKEMHGKNNLTKTLSLYP